MVAYRRHRVPGGTYFFTATLADRRSTALVSHWELLRGAMRSVRARHPFETVAMVVLPDHLHAIWRLPDGDDRYPMRWRQIKRHFTLGLRTDEPPRPSPAVVDTRWARRYWEHTIRDDEDLKRHIDYIHFNPVKHGLVERVVDWPHSTFHRFVHRGWVPPDWGGTIAANSTSAGE
jgi:putative transposase